MWWSQDGACGGDCSGGGPAGSGCGCVYVMLVGRDSHVVTHPPTCRYLFRMGHAVATVLDVGQLAMAAVCHVMPAVHELTPGLRVVAVGWGMR